MQTLDLSREASASVTRFAHFRVSIGTNLHFHRWPPWKCAQTIHLDKAHRKNLLAPGRFGKREGSILRQACTDTRGSGVEVGDTLELADDLVSGLGLKAEPIAR